ncbi:hypothetical protein BA895_01495 [Humibacillus sp. DSM 29435]|nr:hypothetical protein BA895_01495 [Humibacillus sp. DSM 29435]
MAAYIGSARQLTAAAGALNDAEFDWCGSFPLALDTEDSDSESDFEDDHGEGEPVDMLAFVGRWDFRVTDEKAVLRSGRRAYRRAWPKDSKKDAQHRVYNMESAASEILHAHGLAGLEAAKGMSLERWVNTFVALPAGASDTFDSDPFSMASQDDV